MRYASTARMSLKAQVTLAASALVGLSILSLAVSWHFSRTLHARTNDLVSDVEQANAAESVVRHLQTQVMNRGSSIAEAQPHLERWISIAHKSPDTQATLRKVRGELRAWRDEQRKEANSYRSNWLVFNITNELNALRLEEEEDVKADSLWLERRIRRMKGAMAVLLSALILTAATLPWLLKRIQAAEDHFREIAETIDEVFFMTSLAGDRMLYVSPGYARLFGRTCESLYAQPRSWMDSVMPEDRPRVLAAYRVMAVNGFHERYRVKSPSGETRWIEARATPIRDADGQPVRITGLARDITPQKRAEEALLDSQKRLGQSQKLEAVGQLAAGVAHEINNPLGVILGFAQGAVKEVPSGSELEYPLKSIEREAMRCRNLVQDLLTFSRASKVDRQPLDPNRTIAGALSLISAQARLARVAVEQRLGADLPRVLGNANQLQQVIVNLASNALDAMPRGGTLKVETSLIEENALSWVVLTMEDTGSGIPSEIQARVFEPFFTTKETGKGTGLGLSLVHEIVKKHSGSITVESRPGRTVFRIKLPARTGCEAAL